MTSVTMTEVFDPEDLREAKARSERFDRNLAWLRAHASEIYAGNRGRHICIAGEELFVSDSAEQALRLARAAHPDDDGFYLRFIPRENAPRIYGQRG